MNKISTKYFNQVFKYVNTFEAEQRHPAFGSQFETVIEALESLPKKEKVNFLDLGCGLGNILFIAKEIIGKDHKYVGIDNNQSYLDVAKAVDGKFHLMNTDLLSKQSQTLIANADIIYCYLPIPTYRDMQELYAVINLFIKKGAYFICNDENPPKFDNLEKAGRFEGVECCNKTDITIYKNNKGTIFDK